MTPDPIAARYAQALFEAATEARATAETLEQLAAIGEWLRRHPELRQFLWNPGVDSDDKVGLLGRLFKGTWSSLVQAFVRMVVTMGRAEELPEIADAFRVALDGAEGRLRVVVRSAHPLPEAVLERLRRRLEHREHKRIELETELDHRLLGGLQIQLDYRVIDGSVRRELEALRQRLSTVRVY